MNLIAATGNLLWTMLQGVRSVGSTLFRLPFIIPFIAFWFLSILFLLFNSTAIYGANAPQQTTVLLLYMASLAFVFSQSRQENPLLRMDAGQFVLTFLLYASLGAFALKAFAPFVPREHAFLTAESIALVVTHALVVAIGEELLFRFAIPSLIPGPRMAAQTLSAAAFAFMHWAAYGGEITNILFAFLLGLFFGAVTILTRHGLVIAMALHFAYNAFVLGYI